MKKRKKGKKKKNLMKYMNLFLILKFFIAKNIEEKIIVIIVKDAK